MITKREKGLSRLMIAVQVILSLFIFFIIDSLFPNPAVFYKEQLFFLSQIAIIWTFLFTKFRLGIIFRAFTFSNLIYGYVVTICIAGIALFIELKLMLLIGHFSYSVYIILLFCVVDLVALILFKLAFYYLMRYLRKIGRNTRNVVIIGGDQSEAFIDAFIAAKDWGYRIKSIVSPYQEVSDKYSSGAWIKDNDELLKKIEIKGIDDIFYCLPVNDEHYNVEDLLKEAETTGVTVHIMQQAYFTTEQNNHTGELRFDNIFETHQKTPAKYLSLKFKEIVDIFLSAFIIVVLMPLLLLIALLIRLEDKGPVFFKQERVGMNGRRFVCFKFRTMIVNAEQLLDGLKEQNESDGPTFKIENDPRITKIGRLLRKTSLDELPQFYNVIKGEMSIVGPRPPLLREVKQYERSQLRRLSMKPGITCIWQVSGRNSVSFKEWMRMDLEYIDNWSLWLDVKIMLKTVGEILKANGQ